MKYQLIHPVDSKYSATQQILTNRGIPLSEIPHYLNTTDVDINPPEALGLGLLKQAAAELIDIIHHNKNAVVIVDADCDGYTSSAILINYLHELFPTWIETHLSWIMHNGKQHGLQDCISQILQKDVSLVILPDAGTNDVDECQQLDNHSISVIILDHHDKEKDNPWAIIINNQIGNYPNKFLSGAGVTWQFCRYIDELLQSSMADTYRDLVALGNLADMMSLTSLETKHLIRTGFDNIRNPFIAYLVEKNSYSLKGKITPIGAAFYLAPFVNAVTRSGTQEEKELVFESMLNHKAFQELPSTKRGHKIGDTEKLVEQSVRVITNVKARQTKAQNESMERIESLIQERNMLDHKVLLFLLEPGEIDKNLAG